MTCRNLSSATTLRIGTYAVGASFSYDELISRDKASLDIFWLKDDSLEKLDDLPPPDILQQEIIDHLEAALMAFRDVAVGLPRSAVREQ